MECIFPEEKVPELDPSLSVLEFALPVGIPENSCTLGTFCVLAATFSYFPAILVYKG